MYGRTSLFCANVFYVRVSESGIVYVPRLALVECGAFAQPPRDNQSFLSFAVVACVHGLLKTVFVTKICVKIAVIPVFICC